MHRAGARAGRAADPEWQRPFFEFAAHALRNERFGEELVTRYRSLREAIAAALPANPPLPPERIAVMAFAMGNGLALERLLEPDAVRDDDYPTMLGAFAGGREAMAAQPAN
ncbi:MAG: TetR family transcriptional regulator C-terminal domain-containing protein [Actinobacteria bacterium]|nr:TetR family transcriptional regulator C-terminal domain-containing protein [Actinomycetota bacterium]